MAEQMVKYETDTGDITLTGQLVRDVIAGNRNVTDREVMGFMALCKAHRLNPFIKEAHLIKYGDNPATMVVGKDVFTKRAARNPRFRGYQAGLTIVTPDNRLVRREGSMTLQGEVIAGGWCRVFIEGYEQPMFDEVSFAEYAGKKRDGSLNQQWASKPGTMCRKVAVVHALREAFPDDFQGLYDSAEMGVEPPREERAEPGYEVPEEGYDPEDLADEEWDGSAPQGVEMLEAI